MKIRLLAATVLAGLIPFSSQADTPYPTRPVTITVPFGAGASIGSVARIVADKLTNRLGQPFIVEYKAGAGGTLGTAYVAAQKPDGYSLLVSATGTMSVGPIMYKHLPYKSEALTPVAQLMRVPFVIAAGTAFKGRTLSDLMAQIKAEPGKYNFASTGNGTLVHLAAQLLLDKFGGNAQHVPYASGAEVARSLIAGDVLFSVANISTVSPFFADGRIKGLAISGPERFPLLPDMPTVAEAGLSGFAVRHYVGVFAPPGLPVEIADKLNREINAVLSMPEVAKAFNTQGDMAVPASRTAFAETVSADARMWGAVAGQLQLTAE